MALTAVVVERRLAAHHQLDGAAHAAHGAQQDVLGIPVHRGAAVGARARSRCRATGPSPARRARSASRYASARWSPGSGCPAGSGARRAPRRRTGPAGSARRRGPGWRRTRWASRAAARTSTPPSRPTRSGRWSRSRTGTRSRRWAGNGFRNGPARRIRHRGRHGERAGSASEPRRWARCAAEPCGHHRLPIAPAVYSWRAGVLRLLSGGRTPACARVTGRSRRRIRRSCAAAEPGWRSAPARRGARGPPSVDRDGDRRGRERSAAAPWISAVGHPPARLHRASRARRHRAATQRGGEHAGGRDGVGDRQVDAHPADR